MADLYNWPVDSEPGWGAARGAALFSRGAGIIFGHWPEGKPEIYFTTTDAGAAQVGQVSRYHPSTHEGQAGERASPGILELFYESPGEQAMEAGDNLTVAPSGGLILCEDRPVGNRPVRNQLQILTRGGDLIPVATNMHKDNGEFTGPCFSPDASTLFVNIQRPGFTVAINGLWQKIAQRQSRGL